MTPLRYVEPSPVGDEDHAATLAALMAAIRPGAIVRVSDAPTGVPLAPAAREAHRRFVRVLEVRRDGSGRPVALYVAWTGGVRRRVTGLRAGVVGAMVAAPPEATP